MLGLSADGTIVAVTEERSRAAVWLRRLLLVAAFALGFLLWQALAHSAPARASSGDDDVDMTCFDPHAGGFTCLGYPDVTEGDSLTLHVDVCRDDGTFDFCGEGNYGTAFYIQWDTEGDGASNYNQWVGEGDNSYSWSTTAPAWSTSAPGGIQNGHAVYYPQARLCNSGITSCTSWDGTSDLDVQANQAPSLDMSDWDPSDDIWPCSGNGGNDGSPFQTFTFKATVDDPENNSVYIQWDFDDNGTVDATTPSSGYYGEGYHTTTHAYNAEVNVEPRARAVDDHGKVGSWDKYDCGGFDINLETPDGDPSVSMNYWTPNAGFFGGTDGRPSTTFTFSASASDDYGISLYLWDFNGNCPVGATEGNGCVDATSASSSKTYTYNAVVSVVPRVRVKDTVGQYSSHTWYLSSVWGDAYDNVVSEYELNTVIQAPSVTMQWWSPCAETLGACTGGSPDGRPATVFTLNADYSDADIGLGGAVNQAQWDWDGNSAADSTVSIGPAGSGSTSTTHSFSAGVYQPQVRVRDNDSAYSGWDKKNDTILCLGNCDLDVVVTPPSGSLNYWSPNAGFFGGTDGRPSTTFTFSADVSDNDTAQGGRVSSVQWDWDGNGTSDGSTSAGSCTSCTVSTTHSYGAVVSVTPKARAVDNDGATSAWDAYDVLGIEYELNTAVEAPEVTMQWWSPCAGGWPLGCTGGSPDGRPGTFTLNADFDDPDAAYGGRVDTVRWDFDGNGTADSTVAITPAGSGSTSTTNVYAEGVYQPQVEVVDNDSQYSGWDKKNDVILCLGNCDLDVVNEAPEVSMDWWSPCYEILGLCAGGAPDGRPSTVFTLNADGATDDTGVDYLQWDFDGNGTADATTDVGNGVGPYDNVTTTHTYGVSGSWQPQVRAVDVDAKAGAWDKKAGVECFGNCDLDTATSGPDVTMKWWSPCYTIIVCTGGSPDGVPGPFTLNADFEDTDVSLGGQVVEAQWDFDDGSPVATQAITPTGSGSVSTVRTYAAGVYQPLVRVKDNDGIYSAWDENSGAECLGVCDLDVVDDPPDVELHYWSPNAGFFGGVDGRPSTNFSFTATGTDDVGVALYLWDFDGDCPVGATEANGCVDATTAGSSTTHAYGAVVSVTPRVRAKDTAGQYSTHTFNFGARWGDAYDASVLGIGTEYELNTAVEAPEATMQWWTPCFEILGLCSAGGPDGPPGPFTLNADYDDPDKGFGGRVVSAQWDFDGDGTVEQTDAVSDPDGDGSVSTAHTYAAGSYQPQIRFVDNDGATGAFDKKDILGGNVDLDAGSTAYKVSMDCWSPASAGPPCGTTLLGTARDVRVNNAVTLNATVSSCPDPTGITCGLLGYDAAIDESGYKVEWRLNGPSSGATSASVSTSGIGAKANAFAAGYSAVGAYQPEVRICDVSGTSCGGWDKYNYFPLIDIDVDVYGADTEMACWDPHAGLIGIDCGVGSPDGDTSTSFTFEAEYSDPDSPTHTVTSLQWDFDGNGSADATTAADGTSPDTTTHTYASVGVYEPQVRAVASDGAVGVWDKYDILGLNVDLDVENPSVKASMDCWSPASAGPPCGTTLFGTARDVRVNNAVTLNATVGTCPDPTGLTCGLLGYIDVDASDYQVQWRMNGPSAGPTTANVVTSGVGAKSRTFTDGYVEVGAYQPEVRVCDAAGTTCSDWNKYQAVPLFNTDLDVYGPDAQMNCWDPHAGLIGIDCGVGSPDGDTSTSFTFEAEYSDPDAFSVTSLQWDFDGNGSEDATTAADGTSPDTTTHTYAGVGVYEPQVRAVASDGAVGVWDKYDILGLNVDLDVENPSVKASMDCWSPASAGPPCGTTLFGTARDVRVNNAVTLNATVGTCPDPTGLTCGLLGYIDVDASDYQVQWRMNGPSAGPTTANVVTSGVGAKSRTFTDGYVEVGAYQPEVRVCDAAGTTCSDWNKYQAVPLFNTDMDVYGPETVQNCWNPAAGLVFVDCGVGSPDGSTATTFTLSSDYSDPDAVAVTQLQWDFDDDCPANAAVADACIEQTNATASPSPDYANYLYPAAGSYEPKVRAVSADGAVGVWDKYDILGLEVDLDVVAGCTPGADADGDSVPCGWDPDEDSAYYKHTLNRIWQDGVTVLTTNSSDAATTVGLDMNWVSFFGQEIFAGANNFANVDILPSTGIRDIVLSLWATKAVGADADTAYVEGLGICLQANPAAWFFGFDLGICNYKLLVDDDQKWYELEDDYRIEATWAGHTIQYTGFTTPLISPEIHVDVEP